MMDSEDESGVVHFESYVEAKDYETSSTPNKGKYYKQTYRTAWEQMPDFKGWLRGMPGEPTRAFCLYCQKSLHAHRLSLLKHTCTIRHQKAAQLNFIRQQQRHETSDSITSSTSPVGMDDHQPVNIVVTAGPSQDDDDDEGEVTLGEGEGEVDEELQQAVAFETVGVEESELAEHEDGEEEEEPLDLEDELPVHVQKQVRQQSRVSIMTSKPVISTHVLDTSKGQAVSGLQVSLYKLIDGRWTYINEGLTNPDGRFSNFLSRDDFTAGRYKLHFDVDRYFELRKQDTMYPFIEIVFDCRAPGDHYHIPLLLGPYGYTTYRGT